MTNLIEAGKVYQNGFTVEPVAIEGKPIYDHKMFNQSEHDNKWLQMELRDGLDGRSYSWYQFGHPLSASEYCIEVSIDPSLLHDGKLPTELINHYHGAGFKASNPQIVEYRGVEVARATLYRRC